MSQPRSAHFHRPSVPANTLADVRIDLHTHSTASDGTQPPQVVIAHAADAGLDVVALTDHDSTAGWPDAIAAGRERGVAVVPGAELSCQTGAIGVHLLAYLFDPGHADLVAELSRIRDDRAHRLRRMVALMAADLPLTWEDVLAQTHDGATLGRPHIADALVARGLVADRDEAFATLISRTSPYYVRHYAPDAAAVVGLVRSAGGVAVMAHPRAVSRGRVISFDAIADLVAAGLDGLEVDHRDHSPQDRQDLRRVADRLGVLVTGASDYHGPARANRIGEHTTDAEVLTEIEHRAGGVAVAR
jgi:3',5'-nucleoside bisphosphate phosphatase